MAKPLAGVVPVSRIRRMTTVSNIKRRAQVHQDSNFWFIPPKGGPRVINAQSPYMRQWDLVMLILLSFTAIVTPYETAFLKPQINGLFFLNRAVDLLFVFDMFLRFYLMYRDPYSNSWITDKKKIRNQYLTGWFAIDLLSILPFDTIGLLTDSAFLTSIKAPRFLRLFRLLKVFRIVRGASIFRRWESKLTISYGVLSLGNFLMTILLLAHWIACAFRLLVDFQEEIKYDDGEVEGKVFNWMTKYEYPPGNPLANAEPSVQYVTALYFSIMTLTTIGYGDVIPVTHAERSLAIVAMVLGGGVYAYVVGGVCQIVSSLDASTGMFKQRMDTLNEYMQQYGIAPELRTRLREYFHSSRNVQREWHYLELLQNMSPGLRGEVALHNIHWIQSIKFFKCDHPVESSNFITEIALLLKASCFSPNELVIRSGEYNTKLYLVQRGLASKKARIFGRGTLFGEDIVLSLFRRTTSVRALSYLQVQILLKSDLEVLLDSGCYPATKKLVRWHSIKVAFQKNFVNYARVMKMNYEIDQETLSSAAVYAHESLSSNWQGSKLSTAYSTAPTYHRQQSKTRNHPDAFAQILDTLDEIHESILERLDVVERKIKEIREEKNGN